MHPFAQFPAKKAQPWNPAVGGLGHLALHVEMTDLLRTASPFLVQAPPASIASSRRAFASCAEPYEIDVGVRDWISAIRANTAYIVPGSPWENGYCESLNGRWFDDKH